MNPADRSRLMYKLTDLMEEHREALAQLETLDNGKPIRETANADIPLAIEHMRYYAGWTTKITGQTIPVNGLTLTIPAMNRSGLSGKSSLGTSLF